MYVCIVNRLVLLMSFVYNKNDLIGELSLYLHQHITLTFFVVSPLKKIYPH